MPGERAAMEVPVFPEACACFASLPGKTTCITCGRSESEHPDVCSLCGAPATCCLRDVEGDALDSYACDGCCGHGCDVGCFSIVADDPTDEDGPGLPEGA